MRAFILLLVCLFTTLTYADGWSTNARNLLPNYNLPIKDSMVSTIWGNVIKKRYSFTPKKKFIKIEQHQIESADFEAGYVRYTLGSDTRLQGPRPIIFFNPGIFVKLEGRQPVDMTRRFSRLGYRVVTFANPLNRDFISLRPKFEVMDLPSQAKAYYKSIRSIHKKLVKDGLADGRAQVVGVSYGGLLSTIQYYYDSQEERPIFNQGMTAISPPFDFIASARNLNNIVEESKDDPINGNYAKQLRAYFQIRGLKSEAEVNERIREKAKAILGHLVFKDSLVNTLTAYAETYQLGFIPEDKKEYKRWRRSVNFIPAFEQLAPSSLEALSLSGERYLFHWAQEAKLAGHNKIRIIAAEDDVINNGIDYRLHGTEHLYDLSWGGHYGFMGIRWFDELLITEFSLNRPK